VAVRPTFWSRYLSVMSFGAAGVSADLVMTLNPGQTLLRTIVTMDYWLDSTTAEFLDAGVDCAWAVDFGTSNISATRTPVTDFSDITTRWLYIDQLIFDVVNAQDVAGSVSYIARCDARNRYTDVKTQWLNDTAANQYLWFTTQVPSAIYSNATLVGSMSVSGLIMEAP